MLKKCLIASLFLVNGNGLALEKAIEIFGKKLNNITSILTSKISPISTSIKITMGVALPKGGMLLMPSGSNVEITPEGVIIIDIPSPGGILEGVPYDATVQLPDGSTIKAPTSGNVKISTGGTVKITP